MKTERQLVVPGTSAFLAGRPVFTLEDLARSLGGPRARQAARERVKYHLARGRLKAVSRAVYAAVPPGVEARSFVPDRYLVAAAVRPDGTFSHHAALELLGVAHSDWNVCTVLTRRRRPPLVLRNARIVFLQDPPPLRQERLREFGTRQVDRQGIMLRVTGPERSLVDGFRQPRFVGGLGELLESTAGFGVLDLDLLAMLLAMYDQHILWAAVGWFLERFRDRFFVPQTYLAKLERNRPRSKQYLPRGARKGGVLVSRWNLVVPEAAVRAGEPR